MIPEIISIDLQVTETEKTTKTYKLSEKKIQGHTYKLEALKQAIYKVLNTEKYEYPIYSFSYGVELESLIGKDSDYVQVELKRRIEECLLQDERIEYVDNFNFSIKDDEMLCTFDVNSIYGEIKITRGVAI
ncbi:DUF2634 domain-containing protein [Anaerovorax odorimutans]|uniref:DUF2634 domain-containing protein n=1 Tax=Anaerovorax odorimutans TaxID=109327 RepID=UPI0004050110|nr:DUF2634 domain-containing protein [Anaerovorax odorimutans]